MTFHDPLHFPNMSILMNIDQNHCFPHWIPHLLPTSCEEGLSSSGPKPFGQRGNGLFADDRPGGEPIQTSFQQNDVALSAGHSRIPHLWSKNPEFKTSDCLQYKSTQLVLS